jgi:mannose-6-phosphate isomerase-like protein (cupin superfamily)
MKFSLKENFEKLPLPATEKWKDGVWDIETFRQNGVSKILFAPKVKDYQTFHEEDEFYFIARGKGEIVIENERFAFETGDVFFVPAKVPHHFENFTEDFATWAVFF